MLWSKLFNTHKFFSEIFRVIFSNIINDEYLKPQKQNPLLRMDQFQNDTELPLKKKKVLAPDEHLLNTTFATQIQRGFVCLCVYTPASRRVKDGWTDNFCLMEEIRATKRALRGPGVELEKSLSDRILLSWRGACRTVSCQETRGSQRGHCRSILCVITKA